VSARRGLPASGRRSTGVRRLLTVAAVAAVAAAGAAVLAPGLAPAIAAGAASGDVSVTNSETVQVYASAAGDVETRRIYEQLVLVGDGAVEVTNPVTGDPRNLNGFDGVSVQDGQQVVATEVDGVSTLRSVSDYDGELPLRVAVAYALDGKPVQPEELVGATGHLEVAYTVENVSGEPTRVTYDDGTGGTATKTVDVPVPMVGSLTTVAPATFRNVASGQANMGGDGKGGTKLSFTMTLIPPIGPATASFGYSADIEDGVVPRAELSALPVNPLESPSFSGGAASYQGGAESGVELTTGALELDANLLKLRTGAGDLLGGLLKLHEGAGTLESGLADEAVPGVEQLDDGAGALDDGLGLLADGSSDLDDGLGQLLDGGSHLADGAGTLRDGLESAEDNLPLLQGGAQSLADGNASLADGLDQLYRATDQLPASVKKQLAGDPQYQSLLGALDKVVAGIGAPTDTGSTTLLGGLNQLRGGLGTIRNATTLMSGEVSAEDSDLNCAAAVLAKMSGSADPVPNRCWEDYPAGTSQVLGTLTNPAQASVTRGIAAGLRQGATNLGGALNDLTTAVDKQLLPGVDAIKQGLSSPCDPAKNPDACGVSQAVSAVRAGVPVLVDALTQKISDQLTTALGTPRPGCDPTATLRCAAAALAAGGGTLTEGVSTLGDGLGQLSDGGDQLADGAGRVHDGLGEAASGSEQLADGAADASDGSGLLRDGIGRLGAGLRDAADGSGRLADGLGDAADGAPALVDGARQLSAKGSKKLAAAGEETAQDYGLKYAQLEAGAKRADTEKMAVGAPEDATALMAYSYVIKGEDGSGDRELGRLVLTGGMLIAGAGGLLLRRRLLG